MKISDLLQVGSIELGVKLKDKNDAIDRLVELMNKTGALKDAKAYRKGVFVREEESTTGIGEGIAIPHCKSDAVLRPQLVAMVCPEGVDYQSLDGEPAKLFFLIAAPNSEENIHLDVLARLSAMLMDFDFTEKLIAAKSPRQFLALLDEKEGEKKESAAEIGESALKILAVTSCPTGIAHTYMAAEGLENAAKKLGVNIKVETRGSGGARNELTGEEINNAECIIIAADANVPMSRFGGKKVIQTKVADGIHKAEELVLRAMKGEAPVYQATGEGEEVHSNEKQSIGRQIYKHLMCGVSHMLPFVIGGGILKAIGFLCDVGVADTAGSAFGSYTKAAQFFSTIGNASFAFMLPILAMYIAYSIADRPGLVVGFVGGFLATSAKFNVATLCFNVDLQATPGFLGAIFAGFAGGYLIILLKKFTGKIPQNLDGIRSTFIYPLVGTLLMGAIIFLFNVPFSYIGLGLEWVFNKLADASVNNLGVAAVAGLILGAMMSIDFGGPINKAAYVTGTAAIATAFENGYTGSNVMAAVMVGGMVPPIVIALSTTFAPHKWTKKERMDGKVNYLMGLAFITEGAIPYAASDPKRVIPSCMLGAGIAGMLSMLFDCTTPAPHGGIFVFAVVSNWYWYILALVAGSIIGAIVLSALKKKLPLEKSEAGERLLFAKKSK